MTATLHLPDVSEWQTSINWPKVVARNGGAAIVRVHNGSRADRYWPGRRTAAHKGGVRVLGLYAYISAKRHVLDQAREFVALVGALHPGEFAIMDLEEGEGDQHARAVAWLTYVNSHLTYPGYNGAWLYSGQSFFHTHGLMPIARSATHTWVAAYGTREPTDVPHTLWQHTSTELWNGIGRVDCSIFHGTLNELAAKVHHISAAAPPKPAAPTPPKPATKPLPSWYASLVALIRRFAAGRK